MADIVHDSSSALEAKVLGLGGRPAERHGERVQRCELNGRSQPQVADAARCRDRAESHFAHVSGWMPRRQRIARIQRLIAEICADVAADALGAEVW